MKTKFYCLSFAHLFSQSQLHVPTHVDELVKSRIKGQYAAQHKNAQIAFDKSECAEQGSYWYKAGSIVLNADAELWTGRLEENLSDLIDGKSIDFSRIQKNPALASAEGDGTLEKKLAAAEVSSQLAMKRDQATWAPWALLGLGLVGAGAAGGLYYMKHRRKEKPESLRDGPQGKTFGVITAF